LNIAGSLRERKSTTMTDSSSTGFLWVKPSMSHVPVDRSKLRRAVMQTVALRRKQQPKHRHPNSRQLPSFMLGDDSSETTAKQKRDKESNVSEVIDKNSCVHSENSDFDIVPSDGGFSQQSLRHMPVSSFAYPSMLAKCNLNFLDLSLLTSIEVGRYTGQRLLENPRNLSHFLGGKNWSYCRYVPIHYDHSVLVRNATDCVLARVRCLLTPNDTRWESLALSYYSNALSNLQKAINSSSQIPTAEILCATQVLGLYEVGSYLQNVTASY
jgi:hypothetical protein